MLTTVIVSGDEMGVEMPTGSEILGSAGETTAEIDRETVPVIAEGAEAPMIDDEIDREMTVGSQEGMGVEMPIRLVWENRSGSCRHSD